MDRQEFSKILADYRVEKGIKVKELCFKLNYLPEDIRRIEKASHNYNLQKCLDYLDAIGAQMVLSTTKKNVKIKKYKDILSFVVKQRDGVYSQRGLAEAIGCSRVMIAYYETERSVMTIDVLLKISDVLGFTLNIIPNE